MFSTNAWGALTEEYSYTFTAKQFANNTTVKTLGSITWTPATSWKSGSGYWGYDPTKGQQWGSSSNTLNTLTLTAGSSISNIKKITINASTASSGYCKLSVKVGSTAIGSEQTLTATAKNYNFESATGLSGAVQIKMVNNSKAKAQYIKSITIYTESGGGSTCATPTFSPAGGGSFCGSEDVTLSCATDGATIRYTTNGNNPTESSTAYSSAIHITATTTIKAKAFKSGYTASDVTSATYNRETPLTTMDAIYSAATSAGGTETSTCITFNNWVISGVSLDGKNVYLTDGTKGLIIFNSGGSSGFAVGNILSGTVACSIKLYQNSAELVGLTSSADGLTVTTGGSVSPISVDASDISSLSGVNTGCVITTRGECGACNSNKQCINGAQLYNQLYNYTTPTNGTTYTVTGVYLRYGSTNEILPLSDLFTCYDLASINGSIKSCTATSATLKWDNLSNVDATTPYTVTVSPSGPSVGSITTVDGKKNCTISGLTAGNSYTFTINAYGDATHCDASQAISFTAPKITASATITGLDYIETHGPSTAQSFTVSGVGLTGAITIAAPTNFQVSKTSSTSGFENSVSLSPTSGTISSTTIYVRLVAGLSEGTYGPSNVTISGGSADNNTSVSVKGIVSPACDNPVIGTQPTGATYNMNAPATALSVAATGSSLTYQWYSNTTNNNTTGTIIDGATSSSYTPPTTEAGTKYYYCIVYSGACSTTSNTATITVSTPTIATPNPSVIGFGDKAVDGSYEITFTISGSNLAHNTGLTLSIQGAAAKSMYEIDKTSISQTSAGTVASTTVTVTYHPTTAAVHGTGSEIYVLISSTGAVNRSVLLTGTGKWQATFLDVDGNVHDTKLAANGSSPSKPTTDPTSCDDNSTTFVGWTQTKWNGKKSQSEVDDMTTAATKVYTSAVALEAMSGHKTYYPVFAKATSSVTPQTASFGFEEASPSAWTITNINQYSSAYASGSYSGKCADNGSGTIVSPNTIQYNTKLTTPTSISFKSAKSNKKSNDSRWNVQSSSDGSSWTAVDDGAGPTNAEVSQNAFGDPFEVDLSDLSNVYIRISHSGSSPASLIDDIVLSYTAGGTTYSDYLTTCCENKVALSAGTLSHCTISFSNTNPPTCSSTASERRVTITVTPDAGYEITSSEGITFTKSSGTATAEYVSGPTGSGPYTFVYEFTKDDNGAGTFSATCTPKTYTITFDQSTATTPGTSSVDVVFNSALPAIPSLPEKTDYNFAGYFTQAEGGTQFVGSTGTWYTVTNWINSSKEWIKASDKTLYPHWTEKSLQNYRTECPSFAVYNQDGTSEADIHLTSTKDVEIYASEAAGNLIRIIASGLDANGDHPKIGVEYYDANNGDALVTGTDRVFRLSNSSTYDYENDLLDLGENTTEYDQTFSICYVPKDYNQSHHYKLKLILRNNNTEKDNVTIDLYGRSLPKEFVIAAKSGDTWYALPNTLAATEGGQGAISPTAITVDNATTPTKVVNPVGTVIYGACNKYTNANRSGLRFTSDGAHWIQTSSTASAYKMWLSNTGYTNAQDWYLKSTDLSAYEVFMDPIGSPSDKRRIELYNSSGVKMGYHNTGATDARTGVGNVYLLPVEFPSITAHIMEWGTDHVVVDLRTPGSSTKVKTQIGGGAIGDEQSLESVKKDEGVYRLAVSLSSSDALKDLKLYFYNISDVLQGVAAFTIPRIVSSTTTTGSFGTPFKKDAPFVDLVILNGATLTVSETTDGTKFTFRDLYVYGNAKMVVPSGTYIDFSNVYLRGGHLNSSWNYVYSHPQLVLNGTMGNTSNTINYDYLTNNSQFYSLALPYDVTLSTIVNPDFNNKQSWLIHAYDGALRASGSQVSGWYDVEEGSTTGSIAPLGPTDELTAGVGYTFFGAPQKVNSIRQKWSVNRFPMTLASGSAEAAKSGVSVTAHGMTDGELNDGVAPNDAGWNMLGNPFLADIGGTESYETAVKGTILSYHNVKTMDASGNWTGGWHWEENETNVRYVRIPNDLGTEYEQVRFKDATLRAFHHFFIQAGATGTFNFDLATRAQSMPQRIKQGKLLLPEEMDVDFRLSKDEASTKFGLTLCDDFSSDYVMNEDIAEDLSGEAMKAYTLILDQRVTYNGLPFTAAQQIIPVGFRAPNAGEYTFSYKEDENSENIEHIYLTDMRLGVVTDLKDNTYKFASEIGVVDNRFVLQIVFSSNVTTDVEETFEQENGRPLKFIYQGKIYILRNGILYDITGKRVREINK